MAGTVWAPRGHRVGTVWAGTRGASAQLACASLAGQLAAGTCEIVTLDRDSSQPRRTIARQTARCACRKGQIAGTTRARPACVDGKSPGPPAPAPRPSRTFRLGPLLAGQGPQRHLGLPMGVEAGAPQSPRGLRAFLGWSGWLWVERSKVLPRGEGPRCP